MEGLDLNVVILAPEPTGLTIITPFVFWLHHIFIVHVGSSVVACELLIAAYGI